MLKHYARELRNNPTDAERFLWRHLRKSQMNACKFRRQEILGSYIVDFVCIDPKVIIELDGGQHQQQIIYDEERTRYLEGLGYHVLRYWNHEVLSSVDVVLDDIFQILSQYQSIE